MSTKHVLKYKHVQAGSLIGLGAMVFASAADAAVVTGGSLASIRLTDANTFRSIAIPVAGVKLTNRVGDTGKDYSSSLTLTATVNNFVTSNVGLGTVIGARFNALGNSDRTILEQSAGKDANTGAFSKTGLFGFSFTGANNVTNYGWATITAAYDGKKNANSLVATVNAFAYTTEGENILAGVRGAAAATTSVPEADTLAMLAAGVGLIGLTVHRRRKLALAKSGTGLPLAA